MMLTPMRWVLNILAAVLLLLCVLLIAQWVRSRWIAEEIYFACSGTYCEFRLLPRGIMTLVADGYPRSYPLTRVVLGSGSTAPGLWVSSEWRWDGAGFILKSGRAFVGQLGGQIVSFRQVFVPYPYLIIACALFPLGRAVLLFRRHRRRRHRQRCGLCLACGYDLRASTDRCPECGTPIPAGRQPMS